METNWLSEVLLEGNWSAEWTEQQPSISYVNENTFMC